MGRVEQVQEQVVHVQAHQVHVHQVQVQQVQVEQVQVQKVQVQDVQEVQIQLHARRKMGTLEPKVKQEQHLQRPLEQVLLRRIMCPPKPHQN